jgi:hypothetical protein
MENKDEEGKRDSGCSEVRNPPLESAPLIRGMLGL